MTNKELVEQANKLLNLKTLYVLGGIGQPLNEANKKALINQYDYNKNRAELIREQSADTFAFDCSGMIKSILWGFSGDANKDLGGAVYKSNGIPDVNANTLFSMSDHKSTDFTDIPLGALLHNDGHVGIYVGCGCAIECTYRGKDGVQLTIVKNLKNSDNSCIISREWKEWARCYGVTYEETDLAKELLNDIYEQLRVAKNKGVF